MSHQLPGALALIRIGDIGLRTDGGRIHHRDSILPRCVFPTTHRDRSAFMPCWLSAHDGGCRLAAGQTLLRAMMVGFLCQMMQINVLLSLILQFFAVTLHHLSKERNPIGIIILFFINQLWKKAHCSRLGQPISPNCQRLCREPSK